MCVLEIEALLCSFMHTAFLPGTQIQNPVIGESIGVTINSMGK